MCGVPASNFQGRSLYSVFSNVTERIMSPPPCHGGIASQQLGLAVEHADPGRTIELVAGEDVEVAIERLHVDRLVRHRLAAVDQHAGRRAPWRAG